MKGNEIQNIRKEKGIKVKSIILSEIWQSQSSVYGDRPSRFHCLAVQTREW